MSDSSNNSYESPKQPEIADRLAKVIARAGLCSRRDAEGWISAGRVAVNGKKVITPAFNVTSKDKIEVDGLPLAARQGTRVWLYHKPAGLVVTERDPEGRPTIFEEFEKKGLPRVLTVGRLDINTEGLLLLTNDGGLKRVLELPSTGWLRRYRVRAHGSVTQSQLDALKEGITVDGIQYGPITASLEREQGANVWLLLGLREGKNREVKNVLGALGLEVNRLIRISYGPFQLAELAENGVEMVKARMLRDQLGKKLAESAGVDFESEMPDAFAPPPREENHRVRSPRDRDHARPNQARGATRTAGFSRGEDDRPMGRPRRVHFEDDGRAPETYTPKPQGRPGRDGDSKPRSFGKPGFDRSDRPDRGEGRKPYGDRPPRRDGDRPARAEFGDRPKRDYGDRPGRNGFAERPKRFNDKPTGKSFGERPQRDFGDKPARGGFSERPKRSYGDKPAGRSFGDRPPRPFGDKPSRGPRPEGGSNERPRRDYGDRPQRPYGDKSARGNRPDKPYGERPARSQRPNGDRPARRDGAPGGKPFAGRPGGKPSGKPYSKPGGGPRPAGARPTGGRPTGGRPPAGRPASGRPSTGGRPSAGRPPSGPRKPRG